MFGERLKALRHTHKLTQEALAEDLDVARSTIGTWELGKVEPSMKRILQIADKFSVTTDFLLGRDMASLDVSFLEKDEVLILSEIVRCFHAKKERQEKAQLFSNYKRFQIEKGHRTT